MGVTQRGHELSDRGAKACLPEHSSSSEIRSSATSIDGDYGKRVWLKSTVKPHFRPKCQSAATQRSKRRGLFELSLMGLLPVRPFRCRNCDCRFYGLLLNMQSNRSKIPTARQSNG
jgi:hypothetical protein